LERLIFTLLLILESFKYCYYFVVTYKMTEKRLGRAGIIVALALAAAGFIGLKGISDNYIAKALPVTPYEYENPLFNIPAIEDKEAKRNRIFVNTAPEPYLFELEGAGYMVDGNICRTPGVNYLFRLDCSRLPNFKKLYKPRLEKQPAGYYTGFEVEPSEDLFSVKFNDFDVPSREAENLANIGRPYTDEELVELLEAAHKKKH
jgi:hypothetical protein